MNTRQLEEILKLHKESLNCKPQGALADLRYADLQHADLRYANLRYANLQHADLQHANLQHANLHGAGLRYADLQHADLHGADLQHADLYNCIGNMKEIKSMQCDTWSVVWTHDTLSIGCQSHNIDKWWAFGDHTIDNMDSQALIWWKKWKPLLKEIIA